MESPVARVAMVSMHTSPMAAAGSGDSGGLNVVVRSIAGELAARGVEVDLLTRAEGEPSMRRVADGVTLHELPAGPSAPVPKGELLPLTDEFGEAVAQLAGRRGTPYDIIHAHYWLSGLAALPVALELGVPLVQSFHTLGAMKNSAVGAAGGGEGTLEPEARVRSEMFLANQVSAIVAGSSAEVASLIDDVHAPADRIWVIPPGVDVGFFHPERARVAEDALRARLGIAHDRPIIAVVGRVQPFKDQELAIRALAELHSLRGWAPVLVIAGDATPGDDGYLGLLRSVADELGVSSELRFAGTLDRAGLADLLAVATVTVVPSRMETFGLVALESAASGTPVIGYRGSGLVESIADGTSGLLVPSRDPRQWAHTITQLLDDQVALDDLSSSARHHAEGFTWGSTAAALLGVYASLASAATT